jgi:recombination protein RecA
MASNRAGFCFAVSDQYLTPHKPKRGLRGGGFGPHPRIEAKGLSSTIGALFQHLPVDAAPVAYRAEHRAAPTATLNESGNRHALEPQRASIKGHGLDTPGARVRRRSPRLGELCPEHVSRVELSTWFRYCAAVEWSQSILVLLTKHPRAKSAGECFCGLRPAKCETIPRYLRASSIALR